MVQAVIHVALVAGLLLPGFVQIASLVQTASFDRTRLQRLDKGKQQMVEVDFQIKADRLVIASQETTFLDIRYPLIRSISYDGAQNRRSELAPLVGIGALFSKSTSHWLFIEYADGDTTTDAVVQIHKDDIELVMAALEEKTGQSIAILTESRINPTEGSENIDEVVPYSVEEIRLAMRPVMEMYGCQITKDKEDEMECKRGRNENRPGQGCGGEKVTAKLKPEDSSTRVEVHTGKGFMGAGCKKNWSTPMFKEMMKKVAPGSAVGR